MDQHRLGLWFGISSYAIWGVSPIYWKWLGGVPVLQQAAHRVVWTIPILLVVIVLRGRLGRLRAALRSPRTMLLALSAGALLAANWGIYLWAVDADRLLEASLGYFINPLLSVALGVVVLRERLRPAQTAAVGLASAGVLYMTLRIGELPWISLTLAGTFALYGLLKKSPEAAAPLEGLLGETAAVGIPALAFLIGVGVAGEGGFGSGWVDTLLLIGAGGVTASPLLLFGGAVQRIPLSTVGILQYLAPSLQFLLGIAVYGEPLSGDRLIGFGFVWVALIVFTVDNLRRRRPAPVSPAG